MDIFTKKHFTFWIILILVIINLGTLTALWFIRLGQTAPKEPPLGIRPENAQYFLIRELNLDKDQISQYNALKNEHARRTRRIMREVHRLRETIRNELRSSSPDTSLMNRLSEEIGRLHAQKDRILFSHLLDVKSLCGPEQKAKLEKIIDELFVMIAPPESRRSPRQGPRGEPLPVHRPPRQRPDDNR